MTLRGPGLAKHSPPFLPAGSVLPMPVSVEVEVRIQMHKVELTQTPTGNSFDNTSDVYRAVLKVFECFLVAGGYR